MRMKSRSSSTSCCFSGSVMSIIRIASVLDPFAGMDAGAIPYPIPTRLVRMLFSKAGGSIQIDGFNLGEEFFCRLALFPAVTTAGFHAAERSLGLDTGSLAIDTNQTRFNLLNVIERAIQVAGEQGGTQTKGDFVGYFNRFLEVFDGNNRQHRPEDFLLCDRHLGMHVREDGRGNVPPFIIKATLETFAAAEQFCVFVFSALDVIQDDLHLAFIHHRTQVRLGIGAGTDPEG